MAGTAGAIRAGRAFVELFTDKSRLVRGLKSAGKDFREWGKGVAAIGAKVSGVGALIATPLLGFAKLAGDVGGALVDARAKTGLSTEALSTLAFGAKQTGVEMEALTGSTNKMQKVLAQAAGGSKGAKSALASVGLTIAELQGLNPEQQFKLIADRVAAITDPAKRTAAAMALFGKSGTAILPMIAGGAKGLEEMQAQARALGLEISGHDAEAADKFGDLLDVLGLQAKSLAVKLGAALMPMLTRVGDWLSSAAVNAGRWVGENQGLIESVLKLAAGVVVAGGALTGLGIAAGVIGSVFTVAAAAISAVLSPLGLVAAGVGVLVTQTNIGGAALDWFGQGFGIVADDARTAWGAMAEALAAGDLGAAAAVGLGFLKLTLAGAIGWISAKWSELSTWVSTTAVDAWYGAAAGMSDAYGGFESYLAGSFPGLYSTWVDFTTFMKNGWAATVGWLAEKWEAFTGWLNDEDTSAAQQAIAAGTGTTIAANDAEGERRKSLDTPGRLADIEARRAARNSSYSNAAAANRTAAEAEHDQKLAELTAELEQNRAAFTTATDAVVAARPSRLPFDATKFGPGPGGVVSGFSAVQTKTSTAGTFSGALAGQQLGTGGHWQTKMLAAAEAARDQQREGVKALNRLEQILREGT